MTESAKSSLETLKAQLATASKKIGWLEGFGERRFDDAKRFHDQLEVSEAQVRELRELLQKIAISTQAGLYIASALRSAPPLSRSVNPVSPNALRLLAKSQLREESSAPPSASRQAIPLCPKCGFGMTDMADRLVCSDCGHVIRPPATQASFDKTNAGEERCGNEFTLKRGYFCELIKGHEGDHEATCPNPQFHQRWPQIDDGEERKDLAVAGHASNSSYWGPAEQVPAAECHEQDTPANPSRLGTEPQDSPSRSPHKTVPVQVWADIDEEVAPVVAYLNTIPGVRTDASCQGTIGEGGPNPYRAYVMATWTEEARERLQPEFDFDPLGDYWGYIKPKNGALHFPAPPSPAREKEKAE